MKKIKYIIFVSVLFFLALGVTSFAIDENEEYASRVEEELFSSFDEETKEALELFGIEGFGNEKIFDVSIESLIHYFSTNLKDKAKSSIKGFFELLSVLIFVFVFECVREKGKESDLLDVLSVCVVSLILSQKLREVLNIAVTAIDACSKLIFSYVPIFAGVIAVSGNPVAAATYNSLTLMLAEIVSAFANKFVVPFVGVIICLSIAFSMNRRTECGRFLSACSKGVNLSLGASAAFFTGFLTLKNVLSSSIDAAEVKGVRFLVSNLVPVVGSAMSDAYSAFAASINLIKGSVAVVGIVSVFVCVFPAVLELGMCLFSLWSLSFLSGIVSKSELTFVFNGFALGVKTLVLVLIYELFMLVISTGLMLTVKGGV